MRAEDFEYLYNLEESFWWFAAMRDIADAVAGPDMQGKSLDVLDAGCGTGYNIHHYQKSGHRVFSFDISAEALSGVRKRGFHKACQASVTHIPYRSETFDAVFSFDVVQQLSVKDGALAIQEMHRVLKPGGYFFIRVAAFEWMRSSHDDELATAHRYNRPELREMMERAGFEIRLASYANSLLFPLMMLRRSLKRLGVGRGSDVKPLPGALSWIDPILRRILTAEASILGAGRSFPAGLSLIVYARKDKGTDS